MWKIKYGTGAEEPYLYSTNNFLGRQIFEFDENAGSEEERAEVKEARQNFYKNRFKVKPCSDLIWRLQSSMSFSLSVRGSETRNHLRSDFVLRSCTMTFVFIVGTVNYVYVCLKYTTRTATESGEAVSRREGFLGSS